jgi:hypothetical protein
VSEPQPINVRCLCFECEAEGSENEFAARDSKVGSPAFDDEEEKDNWVSARTFAGVIERLLFGA